ncbi:adenylate cyclase [Cellvibrio zantedeschiae]|uniref:Adenylate cyclase n=1 Tax=Cellvibrio zantedeschiae TaxID=1237077 RepID=A0ABQ3B7K7_9GAMM|nr:class I adenylate cyclase [Cellvibrio zantedeschiae]GGY83429.1 adenylate cyclase [Cellvibrio zantedeschiae]
MTNDNQIDFEGIDRKQLSKIKQHFIQLNQTRYQRTLGALSERQQQFLILLPLLFHVNHPMLPGYISHLTPSGVQAYTPSKDDIRVAKSVARSFNYQRDLVDKKDAIEALFVMGSLGTIAHADNSDIDVWVCHAKDIPKAALAELQEKCEALTRWAESIHIETHFFLMESEKFRQGQQALLSSESSGTAQHFLLLDEFYRTAVWLAGRLPLWWFVPAAQEKNYTGYTKNLLEKRFLRANEYIDFGGIPEIPPNEFIGAGIWQLYKGIDSPYKSVLKLLLLEAYANDQFNEPLSLRLKRKIYADLDNNQSLNADELDAYVLVYQRLEEYLLAQNQPTRLELVRRCFYFKSGKHLSRTSRNVAKAWQRLLLEKMVKNWEWAQHQLTMLDNRAYWKSPHVLAERNLLANELSQGYRLLVDMNKNNPGEAAISSNELLILGRKLHAAFERKAGKIDWINPNISQDLSEPALCFVQTQEANTSVWQAYRGSQQDFTLRSQASEPIKRSRNFMELLLWCYGNGIFSAGTKLDIAAKDFSLQSFQRQQLLQVIQQWLPLPLKKVEHESFMQNAQPTHILLAFNVGVEPQADLHKKGMQMLSSQRDAFGYSGMKENLVISVDIVQRNSWGEIVCRHFDSDALVNCLLHYLRAIPPGKHSALPSLTVRCFSLGQGATIEQRVLDLWRAIITCFYSGSRARNTRFIFEMADEYFLLQFVQHHAQILRFATYEKLLEKLALPQMEFSPLMVDAYALRDKPLRLFCEMVKTPAIYLFYQIENQQAQITIVDQKGAFFSKTLALFNVQALLRPLCRFIRTAVERQALDYEHHQDHLMDVEDLQAIKIFELVGDPKQKNSWLEPRNVAQDLTQVQFINVCAVAEPHETEGLSFTLYCDGKEFSALQFGDELFTEVAKYIVAGRKHGETYPCYITDLDLSLCRDIIAPQTGVQLIHYLHIKNDIELKLNEALLQTYG